MTKNISVNPKLVLVFASHGQLKAAADYIRQARRRIYKIFVPLPFEGCDELADMLGVRMPCVIFDNERELAASLLKQARDAGAKYALADNIGHIVAACEAGLELFGGAGLNIANARALEAYAQLGFRDAILSPELKFAQVRDMRKCINAGISAYGAAPLMISENRLPPVITDKTGARFAAAEDFGRSILYNSVPVYLADKRELYRRLGLFFIALNFTNEPPERIKQIIGEYAGLLPAEPPAKFTRGYK